MFDRHSPVGILDSGIGGFSVARQVQRLLPGEDLLYFGDGANIPYGNHSSEEIVALSRYMFRFMEEHRVKALLVACNTISCVAHRCEDQVTCPVFNAVQAGITSAQAAAERLRFCKAGVIATVFTHQSGCYPAHLDTGRPGGVQLVSRGCPDLARLIERHLGDEAGMALVEADLRRELGALVEQEQISCCVLGCTHYSLVEDRIRRLFPALTLIDPAEQMALQLRDWLQAQDLTSGQSQGGRMDIYTTSSVEEYRLRAAQAGLNPVSSVRSYPALQHVKKASQSLPPQR